MIFCRLRRRPFVTAKPRVACGLLALAVGLAAWLAPAHAQVVRAGLLATTPGGLVPPVANKTTRNGSVARRLGLNRVRDPLRLRSSVALVVDQETQEVLYDKNAEAVLPIASITKLMTALVMVDSGLDMDQKIRITRADIDRVKGSRSRLSVGVRLSRKQLLHLALMSSENRAAHALGRTFPGGTQAFVANMNAKAQLLGMTDTQYADPTGLSSANRSSAYDLARLARVAYDRPLIRNLSTDESYAVRVGRRMLQYRNTNALVRNDGWDIGLQKTGYIREAGRCLLMQTRVAGRDVIMVFLDSVGKLSRLGDAARVRRWLEAQTTASNEPAPDVNS
jgi:D-alanyl-D-alanine endopeptidase (penicillin-binding protein 7)